jgi:cytochrome c oxidase subunit 2
LVEKSKQPVHLGGGFWAVTALLAVLSAAQIVWCYTFNFESILPAAIITARQVDELARFLFASGAALYTFILGYIIYFSIKFRVRKSDPPDAIGIQIHDNNRLELWWTIFPAIFVVILSAVSVNIWHTINFADGNGLVVESIGHKWYYTFRYPQIHGEIPDEMHLPVGVPVTLNVTSSDVIHSFWVPAMRLKTDMVPGLVTTITFTPIRPGTYQIICTQFCGTEHSLMNKQRLVIEDRASYDRWYHNWQVKNASVSDALPKASSGSIDLSKGVASAGQATFAQKCAGCHAIGPYSQIIVGPGLKGVLHDPGHPSLVDGDPATPAGVAKILQNGYKGPLGQMPSAEANALSDQDIANLVAYLSTLK